MTRDVGGPAFLASLALLSLTQGIPPGEEGALESVLQNDAFLRVAEESFATLREGDRALLELEEDSGADARERERLLSRAFEAWHAALEASRTGDAVPSRPIREDGKETFRRTVDPCYAVFERLLGLRERHGTETLEAWTRRFGSIAEDERKAAGRETAALAATERNYPATEAAMWAALHLAEAAFERGSVTLALDWTKRAERHASFLSRDDRREAAVEARRALFADVARVAGADDERRAAELDAVWSRATTLEPIQFTPIPDPVLDLALGPNVGPGRDCNQGSVASRPTAWRSRPRRGCSSCTRRPGSWTESSSRSDSSTAPAGGPGRSPRAARSRAGRSPRRATASGSTSFMGRARAGTPTRCWP